MPMTDEERARITANIEKYGWHAIAVKGDGEGPPFVYTIGLETTYRHPEILVFGLNMDTTFMHGILWTMADEIKQGHRYVAGKEYADIVGDFRCAFVDIPGEAYGEYLGTAVRYYRGDWFNAVQCIWPDHNQLFPWDAAVEPKVLERQPVLAQRDGRKWRFGELHKHVAVVTTRQVLKDADPVLRVFHDDDGWQFVGGGGSDGVVVCLGHVVDRDPTLEEIGDLPKGWSAWRERVGGAWERGRIVKA